MSKAELQFQWVSFKYSLCQINFTNTTYRHYPCASGLTQRRKTGWWSSRSSSGTHFFPDPVRKTLFYTDICSHLVTALIPAYLSLHLSLWGSEVAVNSRNTSFCFNFLALPAYVGKSTSSLLKVCYVKKEGGPDAACLNNSAKSGLQQLTLLWELLGAEKGKSSAIREGHLHEGNVDLLLFGYNHQRIFTFACYPGLLWGW